MQQKDGKAKLKISRSIRRSKTQWDSTESRLNSSGHFPRIFVIISFSRDPERLGDKEHQARRLQGPDHLHVNVQRHCVWKKNDENCISNAEEVRNYAMKFLPGHWTFLGPGSEEKWYGDSRQQNGTAIRRDWSSCLQKNQCFESWKLEAKERQMYHSLLWGFSKYRTLVPNSSFCKSAQCVRSGYELVLSVDNKFLTMVEPEKVELLAPPPGQAPGNRMQGGALSFQILEKKVQLTQLCEKAFFQHLVTVRIYYKIRPNADDGWRTVTPLCREYTSTRSYPKTKALSAIPEAPSLDQSQKFTL